MSGQRSFSLGGLLGLIALAAFTFFDTFAFGTFFSGVSALSPNSGDVIFLGNVDTGHPVAMPFGELGPGTGPPALGSLVLLSVLLALAVGIRKVTCHVLRLMTHDVRGRAERRKVARAAVEEEARAREELLQDLAKARDEVRAGVEANQKLTQVLEEAREEVGARVKANEKLTQDWEKTRKDTEGKAKASEKLSQFLKAKIDKSNKQLEHAIESNQQLKMDVEEAHRAADEKVGTANKKLKDGVAKAQRAGEERVETANKKLKEEVEKAHRAVDEKVKTANKKLIEDLRKAHVENNMVKETWNIFHKEDKRAGDGRYKRPFNAVAMLEVLRTMSNELMKCENELRVYETLKKSNKALVTCAIAIEPLPGTVGNGMIPAIEEHNARFFDLQHALTQQLPPNKLEWEFEAADASDISIKQAAGVKLPDDPLPALEKTDNGGVASADATKSGNSGAETPTTAPSAAKRKRDGRKDREIRFVARNPIRVMEESIEGQKENGLKRIRLQRRVLVSHLQQLDTAKVSTMVEGLRALDEEA
ncbi:hypothetical protein B0A50_06975 [Salinomyces thailandicus]|uniref:Uncharacterized protein n=1 Tax=Salinomyces thailandicus TaxID=706561 RepID=A0A4U0TP83_9PEZI|nr:hypothetical protein B0A50_06975 [Salinomyces thailandica]